MTIAELEAIEARAKAAIPWLREDREDVAPETEDELDCPLCGGDGCLPSQVHDAADRASTIVAYGIGDGLALAEAWVEHGAADALALVAEVRPLNEALSEAEDRATTLENEADDAAD